MNEEANDIPNRADDGTPANCGVAFFRPESGPVASNTAGDTEPLRGDTGSGRTCCVCKQAKDVAEFYKEPRRKSGLTGACKLCISERVKRFHTSHRDAVKERKKKHRSANIEEIRAKDRARNFANREARTVEKKAWRDENRERYRAYCRERYTKCKETILGHTKAWANRNRDVVRSHWHVRQARKRAAGGSYTAMDIQEIRMQQRDKCAVCRINLKGKGQVDHILAVSKGGANSRRNLQLLCGSCNASKCARDMIEFMQSRGMLI